MASIIALFKNYVVVTANTFIGNKSIIYSILYSITLHFQSIHRYHSITFNFFFLRYFRMSPERFQHLLGLVSPLITKKDTKMRAAITAEERLAVILRFLANGDSQQSLSFSFRMGKATVSKIVAETSEAIYEVLKNDFLATPKTQEDWLKIAEEFQKTWNMPHVIGCIDGKHIRIECPKLSGTQVVLTIIIKGFSALY